LIEYEAAVSREPTSLWVGSFGTEMPSSQVQLAVGPRPLSAADQQSETGGLIPVSDWTWVEIVTNGKEMRIVAVK